MARANIPSSSTVAIAHDVLASELGAEVVMLNLNDGTYYGLDGAGAEIWKLLERTATVDEIVNALVELYDVDPARCREDVCTLLSHLVQRGLVEIREPS
jgi:hypothetical protein